jgi:hypothetical protein
MLSFDLGFLSIWVYYVKILKWNKIEN